MSNAVNLQRRQSICLPTFEKNFVGYIVRILKGLKRKKITILNPLGHSKFYFCFWLLCFFEGRGRGLFVKYWDSNPINKFIVFIHPFPLIFFKNMRGWIKNKSWNGLTYMYHIYEWVTTRSTHRQVNNISSFRHAAPPMKKKSIIWIDAFHTSYRS